MARLRREAENAARRPKAVLPGDLTQGSEPIATLVQSIKQGRALARLCELHLEEMDGNLEKAKLRAPVPDTSEKRKLIAKAFHYTSSSPRKKKHQPSLPLWGVSRQYWWNHPMWQEWEYLFEYWRSGGHARNEAAILEQLPEEWRP